MSMDKIVSNKNGSWIYQSQLNLYAFIKNQMEKEFLFKSISKGFDIAKKRKEQSNDNLKWALIIVGKTRKMCWVDNKTLKAYKADGYKKTNIEIKNFTFERWCTSFDL
jgi:hypothetical protein